MGVLLTTEKKAYSVGSTSTYAYKFKLEVIENSTNVVNNTSNVTINLYGATIGSYNYSGFKTPKATIKVDGTEKVSSVVSGLTSTKYTLIAKTTYDIEHTSNGTKTINVVGEYNPNTSSYTYLPKKTTITGSVTLSTIAQRTEITVSDTYIESKPTILLNKKNDNFTTTLRYKFEGLTNWTTIVEKTANKTYYNDWAIPTSAYTLIPNDKRKLCIIQAITYSGNEQVGEAYETSFYAVANEEKCRPSLSSLSITNSVDYSSLTGSASKFIKYISKPKITWIATPKNEATISNQTINGTSCTSPYISSSWLDSYTIGAVDSRGFINTFTYNSSNMNVVDYIPLTIAASAKRHSPTDGKVVVSISGNWFNGNFGVADNTLTAYYKYRKKGTDSWTTSDNLTITKTSNTYSYQTTLENFVYTDAFEFIFYISDKVSSINSGTIQVPSGKTVADWGKDDFRINVPLSVEGYDMASKFSSKNKFSTYLVQMSGDAEHRTTKDFVKVKPNTTYVFSSKDNNVNFLGNLQFYNSDQLFVSQVFTFTTPFTTPSNCEYIKLIFANANAPLDAELQLEEGTEKTSFAPYIDENVANATKESIANANIFRNILNCKYKEGSTTMNGITYKFNSDGSILLNGTATDNTSYVQLSDTIALNGTYTLSLVSNDKANIFMRGLNVDNSYSIDLSTNQSKRTNTINSRYVFCLYVDKGTTLNYVRVYPQLEKGTLPTSFSSWAGYIEESGSNDNGNYIKYSDGTMICRNKMTINKAVNIAYGGLYRSVGIDFSNFPKAFIDIPDISYSCIGINTAFIVNWSASTKEKIGSLIAIRPTTTNAQDYIISYTAIGRWK